MTFYLIWHGIVHGKNITCPLKIESDSETSADNLAQSLIQQGENTPREGYETKKFVLLEKNPDGSKRMVKEYLPPFS